MNIRYITTVTALLQCALITPAARAQVSTIEPLVYPAGMDTTCAPCRDFFRYANGRWLDTATLSGSQTSTGVIQKLVDRNARIMRQLLEDAGRAAPAQPTANTDKAGVFYATCMDSAAAEADGASPIAARLLRIAGENSLDDVFREAAQLQLGGSTTFTPGSALFSYEVTPDPLNTSKVLLTLMPGRLSLPSARYYLAADSAMQRVRQTFRDHVRRMLVLAGTADPQAAERATWILDIESALARATPPSGGPENPLKTYHKRSLAEMERRYSHVKLRSWLAATGATSIDTVSLADTTYFAALDSLLNVVPLERWNAYLQWITVRLAANHLATPFVAETQTLRAALTGTTVLRPRWQRCVALAEQVFGHASGELFVARWYGPEVRARVDRMIADVREALNARLARVSWMDESTRRAALAKAAAIRPRIGYSTELRDYRGLVIAKRPFFDNLMAVASFDQRRELAGVGRQVRADEWPLFVYPSVVNAGFNEAANEVIFPAGVLQYPLFDPAADDAVNYGGIGSGIAHEILHAFDAGGRHRDEHGNVRDWWTTADNERYEQQAARLVAQFNGYLAVDTIKVNGRLTLGENLADLAGVQVAYDAFQLAQRRAPAASPIDGFTPDQRFFLAYAAVYRVKRRPQLELTSALTDPHAPARWRVNGILANVPAFARAFHCHPGDPMAFGDRERVEIF